LESLHWLPVRFRVDFKIILQGFAWFGSSYLSELLILYIPTCDLHSSEAGLLTVPPTRLRFMGIIRSLLLLQNYGTFCRSKSLSIFKSPTKRSSGSYYLIYLTTSLYCVLYVLNTFDNMFSFLYCISECTFRFCEALSDVTFEGGIGNGL